MLIGGTLDAGFISSLQAQFTITVRGAGLGRGRIDSGPAGTPALNCLIEEGVASGVCVSTYNAGAIVTVVARPDVNVTFVGWAGPCTPSGQDCVLTMNQNYTITANFFPSRSFTLTVNVTGNGYGVVNQLDLRGSPKLNCGIQGTNQTQTCTASYPATTYAWLEKTPGIQFASSGSFSGACSGDPCRFRMDGDRSVTATFLSPAVTVRSGAGTGRGRVTASVGGIDCAIGPTGATGGCAATYASPSQQTVSLTATADNGSRFAGWTVSDRTCAGVGSCVISSPAFGLPGTIVTARFNISLNSITLTGTGSGTVKSTPGGVDCLLTVNVATNSCSAEYTPGAPVTLNATPATGWQFASWGGACASSTTTTCELQMSQDRLVSVTFTRTQVTLTVAAAGTGEGKVASTNPSGAVNCDVRGANVTGTCTAQVLFETPVTLTATAGANSTFEGWSLASCTGTGQCVVPMTGSQTVTATFRGTRVTVTVSGSGNGNGLITAPDGMNCRVTRGAAAAAGCETSAILGGSVVLTAVPQDGSIFGSWSLASCPATSLSCTVPVNQATSVSASFTAPPQAAQLIDALLLGPALSAVQASELDKFGNKDGTFNLGDLIAHLDRTNESVSPALLARLLELERTQSQRPSPRRGAP